MTATLEAPTDTDIFSRVISAADALPTDFAPNVLSWKFPISDLDRVQKLQTKNSDGTISNAERSELESFVRVGQFVAVMQAKARLTLKGRRGKKT